MSQSLQLEFNFAGPPAVARVIAFPLTRTAIPMDIAREYVSRSADPAARSAWLGSLYQPLLDSRIDQGLSPEEAKADVMALTKVIRAEVRAIERTQRNAQIIPLSVRPDAA